MGRTMPDDARAWRRAVRDVAPLPGRSRAAPSQTGSQPQRTNPPARPLPQPPLPPPDRVAGIDRATAERLKRGRYPLAARLDLHGMTQEEAHRALAHFLAHSRTAGRRGVLVITGHGRSSGGVLKAAVPRWLDEPGLREHVLALAPARPKDGGAGALYLLLRRPAR
jgi:DNA-nicking Smr family endonuclease